MLPSAALPTSALPITHIGATTYGPPFPLLRHRRTAGEGSTTAYASGVPGRGRHERPLKQCTRQSCRHVACATRPACSIELERWGRWADGGVSEAVATDDVGRATLLGTPFHEVGGAATAPKGTTPHTRSISAAVS